MGLLGLIVWLVVGGLAGLVAGRLMSGHGYGVLLDIVLGIVGGLVGGFLLALVGLHGGGLIWSFVTAILGACILVGIVHMVRREPMRTA